LCSLGIFPIDLPHDRPHRLLRLRRPDVEGAGRRQLRVAVAMAAALPPRRRSGVLGAESLAEGPAPQPLEDDALVDRTPMPRCRVEHRHNTKKPHARKSVKLTTINAEAKDYYHTWGEPGRSKLVEKLEDWVAYGRHIRFCRARLRRHISAGGSEGGRV
jgi:hypothetical protein